MSKKNESLHTLVSPSVLNRTESKSGSYEYQVRLDNQTVKFPDAEPNISKMLITHIDMDPTERCNLRCSYCFKGKLTKKDMSLETAKQSVRFLVKYSGDVKKIGISLLGGEPLLAFSLLEKWVPWAYRYCEQRDKKLTIGVTTNGTVFDQKHHDFFKIWGIGMHLSLDGMPEVQDQERVFASGIGSSQKIEENLPRIFSAWRTIHARSTIVPETVNKLLESYKYFCDKGFCKVAFAITHSDSWKNQEILNVLKTEFRKVLDYHWGHMKKHNKYFVLEMLDNYVKQINKEKPEMTLCGAGRGSLHVDTDGLLWPCHRFAGEPAHQNLIIGSIWGGFNNTLRNCFLNINPNKAMSQPCDVCEARFFCRSGCLAANWQEQADLYNPGEGFCRAMALLYKLCKEHSTRLQQKEPDQWSRYTEWVSNYKW